MLLIQTGEALKAEPRKNKAPHVLVKQRELKRQVEMQSNEAAKIQKVQPLQPKECGRDQLNLAPRPRTVYIRAKPDTLMEKYAHVKTANELKRARDGQIGVGPSTKRHVLTQCPL